jgi:hypothetical protein
MYNPKTLKDSHSATSLQASVGGQQQLGLLDGMTNDPCGQEAHPVSHSVQQETKKDKTTLDTSGRCSSISSASVALQLSLENRLQQRLEQAGSTIYKLTWKQKVTPQQWSYCQRAASVPRIKETDSGQLQSAWPTPMTADNRDRGSFDDPVIQRRMRIGKSIELSMLVYVVTSGPEANTYTAETGRPVKYQLNPRFSLWLMGYPIEWAYCGERVTPLSRKSQRKL